MGLVRRAKIKILIFKPMNGASGEVAVKQNYNFQYKQLLKNQKMGVLHLLRIDLIMGDEQSS